MSVPNMSVDAAALLVKHGNAGSDAMTGRLVASSLHDLIDLPHTTNIDAPVATAAAAAAAAAASPVKADGPGNAADGPVVASEPDDVVEITPKRVKRKEKHFRHSRILDDAVLFPAVLRALATGHYKGKPFASLSRFGRERWGAVAEFMKTKLAAEYPGLADHPNLTGDYLFAGLWKNNNGTGFYSFFRGAALKGWIQNVTGGMSRIERQDALAPCRQLFRDEHVRTLGDQLLVEIHKATVGEDQGSDVNDTQARAGGTARKLRIKSQRVNAMMNKGEVLPPPLPTTKVPKAKSKKRTAEGDGRFDVKRVKRVMSLFEGDGGGDHQQVPRLDVLDNKIMVAAKAITAAVVAGVPQAGM